MNAFAQLAHTQTTHIKTGTHIGTRSRREFPQKKKCIYVWMAMVNNIMDAIYTSYMLAIGILVCVVCILGKRRRRRRRITVLCSRWCWCRLLQHFRWSIASRRFYRSILALDASKKVDAPTDELNWPFLSENVSVNAFLFHDKTMHDAVHVQSRRTYASPSGCVAAWLARSRSHLSISLVWQIICRFFLCFLLFASREKRNTTPGVVSPVASAHKIYTYIWCLASPLLRNKFRRLPSKPLIKSKS